MSPGSYQSEQPCVKRRVERAAPLARSEPNLLNQNFPLRKRHRAMPETRW
jgi:hypothetical protein